MAAPLAGEPAERPPSESAVAPADRFAAIRSNGLASRQGFILRHHWSGRDATAHHSFDDSRRRRNRRADYCRGLIPYSTLSSSTRRTDEHRRAGRSLPAESAFGPNFHAREMPHRTRSR